MKKKHTNKHKEKKNFSLNNSVDLSNEFENSYK